MGIYVEAIILYIILFFSGSAAQITGTAEGFSAIREIYKILFYFIPSIALIWYLLIKSWKLEYWVVRPGRKDITAFLITLPVLLFTGFVISYISSIINSTQTQTALYSPGNPGEWVILCFTCIFSAYLEESFFRFYLLKRREELNLNSTSALILSAALFSMCHIYEGPWGFLNAVLSGTFLAFIFLRYNSLHGIAAAHAIYNISVFIINAVIN